MDKDLINGWIDAAVLLSETPDALVICPSCGTCELSVFDVSVEGDNSEFERVMYCPHCQQHNSIRMHGEQNYVEPVGELTPHQQQISSEIRAAYRFSFEAVDAMPEAEPKPE